MNKMLKREQIPDDLMDYFEKVGPPTVKNFHPCLHPDALVMTDQGYRPISEIQPGQRVYSADGQFHRVEHVSRHEHKDTHLRRIAVMGTNYTEDVTGNHPFLIWRPVRKGKSIMGGDVGWLEAQGIQKGDYTMTPLWTGSDEGTFVGPPVSVEGDLWFLFGLWLAEGIAQRAGHGSNVYPSYTLHEDETDLISRIKKHFGEARVGVYPKKGTKAVQVVAFCSDTGKAFVHFGGRGASTKSLNTMLWRLPLESLKAIFEGYMAGDGGRVRTWRQAKTVSPDLASQMRLVGEALGYKANLFRYEAQPGKIGNRKFKKTLPHYQIRFYSRNGNQTTRKPSCPTFVVHEGVTYRLSYVQEVTKIAYQGDVVNLTVDGSPTFQTAVGMSHNTVKPMGLMERLLDGITTIEGPVLDPFLGSGTTGIACLFTGHDFIGIDREAEYLEIADARTRHWEREARCGLVGDSPNIISDKPMPKPEMESLDDLFGWGEDD